ncbi:protein-L-isoaspartate O-methyltransferase [Streptomyces sp. B6B3]|uniref:protein-L-isoaspartate O-methyltransferase n=1 Tax=Streptomyces sp. B6B3 TaxID=3153570 RepID=UPI00325D1AA9
MDAFVGRRERLAAAMAACGAWPERSPWVREAFDALPRHRFAPERLWRWDGDAYLPIDRAEDPEAWADEVYGGPDDPAVTRVNDGVAVSSMSCPSVVADMLDALLVQPGHRVLELGAGSGWNAALLAWRAGPGRVVSVEVDAGLAATASGHLRVAGVDTAVEIADGVGGWPAGAPFDRVIATYAVERVPWAWIEQTRPGGRIVAPWGRLGHVALTVAEDGRSATGWVQGLAMFMPARGSRAARGWRQVRGDEAPRGERAPKRDPRALRDNAHLLFALRVALPDVRITTGGDHRGEGATAWLDDGVASWATLVAPDDGEPVAYLGGPRDLLDEVERAWDDWRELGEPGLYDHGMTVEPDRQYVWCHDPVSGPRWPM